MKEKNIFVSYGHGVNDEIVYKLVDDLRGFGFNVFLDIDYLKIGDWEEIINEHILASEYFLFINTYKSVSKEGYCLNELCRAGEANLTIVPIVLEDAPLPLSINKYERMSLLGCLNPDKSIDMQKYRDFMINLIGVLNGSRQLKYSDSEVRLKQYLKPIVSSDAEFKHYSNFCGREEEFLEFERFLNSNKNLFWVCANPGMGKTAFSAMLMWKYPEYVVATHFCKFNNSDRVNPKMIISSIAYQLLDAVKGYKEKILGLINLDTLFEKNASRMFEYLITEPCADLHSDRTIVIVIDALDECSWRGSNEICLIFQRMREYIPSWMKFVVTSRNEIEIRRILQPISYSCVLTQENTEKDIRTYYETQFPGIDNKKVDLLLTKSEGSFLYATEIVRQIQEEKLSLDDINFFPIGIYGFFNDCFSRIFGVENERHLDYKEAMPLLEILCVSPEPTDIHHLEEVLQWDEYKLREILMRINGMFSLKGSYIEPLHKSLIDWLTTDDIGQIFYINKKNGYKRLLSYIETLYEQKAYDNNKYVLKYFSKILIELEKYDRLLEILDDYELQRKTIDYCEFDSGVEGYIGALEALPYDDRIELFSRETFISLFSEHRRLLYNSGMFFNLRKLGLSQSLGATDAYWGVEGEVGKVFYYYIIEDFHKAIRKAESLLNSGEKFTNNPLLLAEIYNVKGLSERKLVLFEDALKSFDKVIDYALNTDVRETSIHGDIEFELSLAYLIKGKIYASMLNFAESNRNCKNAIKILSRHINEMVEGDKKISNKLFLAEENRVLAYGYIWQGEYAAAEERLNICEGIYQENNKSIDRYFVRYQYTYLLLKIMTDRGEMHVDELQELLNGGVVGEYDKGYINFLIALDIFLNSNGDVKIMEDGMRRARNGSDIFDSIDAILEKGECDMISLLYSQRLGKNIFVDVEDCEYITQWTDYMRSEIERAKADE